MIPNAFNLSAVQEFARDVYSKFDLLLTGNPDFKGRRISNAGKSVQDFDYVTRFELDTIEKSLTAKLTDTTDSVGLLNAATEVRFGAFATRGSSVAHANELFYASDMDYMGWFSTGAAWLYVSGVRSIAQSAITTFTASLTTSDAGALINVTDYTHMLRWTGSATEFAPGDSGSGYIQGFPITPPGGTWGLCDGTAYDYLKADGTTANFTTPNYATAAYLKLWTSVAIGPTAAGGVTATEGAHTHAVDPPSTASGNNSASETVDNTLGGSTVAVAKDPHTHTTDIGSFSSGAGSAHSHGPGTLELRQTALIGYFRR